MTAEIIDRMSGLIEMLQAAAARINYKTICAACGKPGLSPVFTSDPQFCNRTCHDAYEALMAGPVTITHVEIGRRYEPPAEQR